MYYQQITFKHSDTITQKLKALFSCYENVPIQNPNECYFSYDLLKSEIPELDQSLREYNLEVFECFLFQTKPNEVLPMHIDYNQFESPTIALNWPVFNCKNTQMTFFTTTADILAQEVSWHPVYKNNFVLLDPQTCTLVDSLELTEPHLIDVNAIHGVNNISSDSKHRLIMSLRFKDNPLHLWNN